MCVVTIPRIWQRSFVYFVVAGNYFEAMQCQPSITYHFALIMPDFERKKSILYIATVIL